VTVASRRPGQGSLKNEWWSYAASLTTLTETARVWGREA
jgi:hypothetical protein